MKFCLCLSPIHRFPDLRDVLRLARRAEELGFSSVQVPEHVLVQRSEVGALHPLMPDPLVLGTAIATATQRVKIFFNVLVLPYHHPITLAKALATLDHVSGGRVIAGIGVGWLESEFKALGVPFRERGAITHEGIQVMRELWTREYATFKGRYVQFEDVAFEPKPVQRPHIPIWVGGGVRRSLERAAELGDGWHPLSRPWAQLEAETGEVKRLLAARGRPVERFTFSYTADFGARDQLIKVYAHRSGASDPIILSDRTQEAAKQLDALARLGFSHLMVRFPAGDARGLLEMMERFHGAILRPLGPPQGT